MRTATTLLFAFVHLGMSKVPDRNLDDPTVEGSSPTPAPADPQYGAVTSVTMWTRSQGLLPSSGKRASALMGHMH